ncbi:MAG: hypothetical protein QOJ35_2930 [Solirubrobacteraceae bacterium]|jgi:hypothetical protein|nr:hypothetical protein [Solirubrobacteraceae bacterium]
MSYALERVIERFAQRMVGRETGASAAPSHAVVIRPARDADQPLLRDLAVLDSAEPLRGPVLVAVVDGRPWAAHGLDDDRVIADPFEPSAEAAGLLRLRVRQLRASAARSPRRVARRRRLAGRARVS